MPHTRLSVVVIAFALVVAACTSDSDDTTTTATASETTTATTTAIPDPYPPTATNTPSAAALIEWSGLDVVGLDRCAWSDGGNQALWEKCKADAVAHSANATLADAQHELDGQLTESVGSGDDDCLFIPDEFVSPAPLSVVTDHTDAELISEAGELPGGLFAYATAVPREAVRSLLDASIPASLRYVVVPAQRWKFGPGSVALPADPTVLEQQGGLTSTGSGVVSVIDTGAAGSEPPSLDSMFVGHGQFIAGIISRLAPSVTYTERSAFGSEGDMPTEHSVIEQVTLALSEEFAPTDADPTRRGVVNLSLGTYACGPGEIPLELAAYIGELVLARSGAVTDEVPVDVVFVAAAGNDGEGAAPFWPAAFSDPDQISEETVTLWREQHAVLATAGKLADPTASYESFFDALDALRSAQGGGDAPIIVGAGALVSTESGWEPVAFSNQVGATVWAPGANIVSNYPASQEPDWQGFAQWDGTSFAAPHVSALVASCFDPGNLSRGYGDILSSVLSQGGC